jgi:hypothetical protein
MLVEPMLGPGIIVRSMSARAKADPFGNRWQYHPRSDDHSKVACWAILFDLLLECDTFRRHVAAGDLAFGINHEMRDFKNNRKKRLDLVVCTPGTNPTPTRRTLSFAELADQSGVVLHSAERRQLATAPALCQTPVGTVRIALEAKACMTEHGKARPRLYDELNSSHLTVHGASDAAVAAAFVTVNASLTFVSPLRNQGPLDGGAPKVTTHVQPRDAASVIAKVEQLPRRLRAREDGYDALGILVIDARNDGSPIRLVETAPAPAAGDNFHYDQLIRRTCERYERRFAQD